MPLVLPAPAKLNLFLHITGQRADGYHELQTLFQIIDFGDELIFQGNDSGQVTITPQLSGVPLSENLIYRAAQMIREHGYAPSIRKNDRLQYLQITTRDLWYEDVSSPLYNQYRRLDHEPRTSAEKKAQMRQDDHAHSLKLFIAHNAAPNATPGMGSSIFFHIWRGGGSKPTAGCTTMSESNLKSLIARLDPSKQPVYVLLPKSEYDNYRSAWKLP